MPRPDPFIGLLAAAVLSLTPMAAGAWQRPGHAAGAAMTYDDLARRHPDVVRRIVAIMADHPDRSRFDQAMGVATGAERDRRLFMAMARWPDDIRGTTYDRPSWHYWMSPYVSPADPPPKASAKKPYAAIGEAREAFALNLAVASDQAAPAGERAVALCWVFHILQDVHQPLHATQLFSGEHPTGDRGGSLSFVRIDAAAPATTFHRFWDERVLTADATLDDMEAKARDLQRAYPRTALPELKAAYPPARRIESWARAESLPLARSLAYESGRLKTGLSPETSTVPPSAYQARSKAAAERRLALASYRLSDVLAETLKR